MACTWGGARSIKRGSLSAANTFADVPRAETGRPARPRDFIHGFKEMRPRVLAAVFAALSFASTVGVAALGL